METSNSIKDLKRYHINDHGRLIEGEAKNGENYLLESEIMKILEEAGNRKWKSIVTNPPEQDGDYLVKTERGTVGVSHYFVGGENGFCGLIGKFAMYWMPLPVGKNTETDTDTITVRKVAKLFENFLGDPCACNYADVERWLPKIVGVCPEQCDEANCWEKVVRKLISDLEGANLVR